MTRGWRALAPACLLAFGLCASGLGAETAAPQDAPLALSLNDARMLAAQALANKRPDLARDIGMGLLKADPEDAYAYAILTRAHVMLGNPKLAQAGARLAYRHSDTARNKFAAAHTAASLALARSHPNTAQVWLRRAALHASSPQEDAVLQRGFRVIRAENPWRLNVRGSLTPSNNVNNGSDATETIINGTPSLSFITGRSRALSGWVGALDVQLGYRLTQSKTHRTTLAGRVYTRQVELSSDARAQAPGARNSDYGATYVDASLDHAMALGAVGNTAGGTVSLGALWSAGSKSYEFARLGLRRGVQLGPRDRLSFDVAREWRDAASATTQDATVLRLGADYQHKLESGNTVTLSLDLQELSSTGVNSSYEGWTAQLAYRFARRIGPAQVSTAFSFGETDYSTFSAPLPVPGGRQDQTLTGSLSLFFPDYDVAGFAPSVDIKARKRRSNISLYDTSEVSLGLGIRSKF